MRNLTFYILFSSIALFSCAQKSATTKSGNNKTTPTKDLSGYSTAVFASGCFWHTEALFDGMKGVIEAVSGYSGGHVKNPTYEMVVTGKTGHAESVKVYYDSTKVSYETLMKAYFEAQDPTSVNGQGADRGTQYRSIAFYETPQQKKMLEDYIDELNNSGKYKDPIAVQIVPADKFWEAEEYHQEFALKNPDNPYVQNVCIKDVQKFQKKFPELIKPGYRF